VRRRRPVPAAAACAAAPARAAARLAARLAALALLAALASCTGTTEPRPPTLLVVGFEAAGGPTLALVEDAGPTAAAGGATTRLRFVAGSERPLLGWAVGIDIEDREGTRPNAWVLTRTAPAGGAVDSWLQRFEIEGIDPAAPTAFLEDLDRRVPLSGAGGVLTSDDLPGHAACPRAVQVSRAGRWAVVLDDPAECGFGGFAVQWLVDTEGASAQPLRVTGDVLAASPVTDQLGTEERAYFLIGAPGDAQVFATDFAAPAGWYRQARLGDSGSIFDLAANGTLLVGLSANRLSSLDLADPAAPTTPGTLDVSATSSSRLVTDPFGATTEVFVLGSGRVGVHRSAASGQLARIYVDAAAGTIDPVNRYAYLLSPGAVTLVDLLSGPDEFDTPLNYAAVSVPELTLPTGQTGRPLGVLAWTWALATAAP